MEGDNPDRSGRIIYKETRADQRFAILAGENARLRKELEAEIVFLRTADSVVRSSILVLNRLKKLEAALGQGHPLDQIPTVRG